MARRRAIVVGLALVLVLSVGLVGIEWLYIEGLDERRNNDAASDPNKGLGDLENGPITPRHVINVDERASPNTPEVPKEPAAPVKKPVVPVREPQEVPVKSEAVRRHVLLEDRERLVTLNKQQIVPVVINPTDVAPLDRLPLVKRKTLQLRQADGSRELWWTVRAHLSKLKDGLPDLPDIDELLVDLTRQYQTLAIHAQQLGDILDGDPNGMQAKEVAELLQRRLHYLQNPPSCSTAKKVICRVAKPCGFACQIHHLGYCFVVAYATERTLVIDDRGWKYSYDGWNKVFLPLSDSCTNATGGVQWTHNTQTSQSVILPYIESMNPRLPQLPMAIPRDLAGKIASFHGYPFIWFFSQLLHYIMRPNAELQNYIETKKKELGFQSTIVGVHIRRTDKLKSEASYHSIDEYMKQVEEWYSVNRWKDGEEKIKRVYLASDEPQVLDEARLKYPSYVFISDREISSLASKSTSRYSLQALYGVVFDVVMLSHCNYIVCTFSSQVCRLAYELMQSYHVDASRSFYSLDDVYYYGGQQAHDLRPFLPHNPKGNTDELSFDVGDLIGIAGNEKEGWSLGTNRKTQQQGIFPSYKAEEYIVVADFPTYPQVT